MGGFFFCLYIAFVAFCFLNVVTAICVEQSMNRGMDDKRRLLLQEVRAVLTEGHHDDDAEITFEEFESYLQNRHMLSVLKAIDVDVEDAHELFHLLDSPKKGAIQVDEFVNGCLQLDGPAKAIDLAVFVKEYRDVNHKWLQQIHFVNTSLNQVTNSLRI